jgi:aminoglycoside/choline kinase family phosphotransferase
MMTATRRFAGLATAQGAMPPVASAGPVEAPAGFSTRMRTMNNSKTRSKPTEDAAAQAGALGEFDRLHAILRETHVQIPQLLARQRDAERALGLTETEELRKQLADLRITVL